MIKIFLRRLIRWAERGEGIASPVNHNQEWMEGTRAVARIYEVGNGYLYYDDTTNNRGNYGNGNTQSNQSPALFCKDHQEIADLLLRNRTLNKLNP